LNRRGPLHPAWLTALRSPFAARSVPFALESLTLANEFVSDGWQATRRLSTVASAKAAYYKNRPY